MTGKHLKIQQFSDNVQGVELFGNPKQPEPIYFRVRFPGGDVDIVRLEDESYWVHVRVDQDQDGGDPDRTFGKIVDGRLDVRGMHASESNDRFKPLGLPRLYLPSLYHVAVRVEKAKP